MVAPRGSYTARTLDERSSRKCQSGKQGSFRRAPYQTQLRLSRRGLSTWAQAVVTENTMSRALRRSADLHLVLSVAPLMPEPHGHVVGAARGARFTNPI